MHRIDTVNRGFQRRSWFHTSFNHPRCNYIENDWAANVSQNLEPHFELRRAAAAKAYWEHMPFSKAMRPTDYQMQLLERSSGLKWRSDFNVGYSPERINPGDRERRFETILKVLSADTPETLEIVDAVYRSAFSKRKGRDANTPAPRFIPLQVGS